MRPPIFQNADMVVAGLSIEAKRAKAIAFSIPYSYEKTVMTYRPVDSSLMGSGMVAKPLHWLIYILTAASVLVVTLVFIEIEKFHAQPGDERVDANQWMVAAFLIYEGLFKQCKLMFWLIVQ